MADKPKNNLPKVPPFIIPGASNQYEEKPTSQAAHVVQAPKSPAQEESFFSQRGLISLAISLISLVSLGISMVGAAFFAYEILKADAETPVAAPAQAETEQVASPTVAVTVTPASPTATPTEQPAEETTNAEKVGAEEAADTGGQILSSVVVIGLVFAVGWVTGTFGIRALGNLILPFVIRGYAILTLGGILYLQFRIIEKLFLQKYLFVSFVKYLTLFGAGILALVLLHLMLEKHNLLFFGVLILFTSLAHLYLIAFHYIFVPGVKHNFLWGDIGFFLVTTTTSALMIAHFGLLNGARRFVDRAFSPKDNQFIPAK